MTQHNTSRPGWRKGLFELGFFSFVINMLLLAQPVYMLQVYDRVLPSASVNTLVFLSLITLAALVVLGLLDAMRQIFATRLAARIYVSKGAEAFLATANGPRAELGDVQVLRDLATIRGFVGSRVMLGLFDLPFVPLFLILLLFIHPWLFYLTVAGVVLVALLAYMNQHFAEASGKIAAESTIRATGAAQNFAQSAETIRSMGMTGNVVSIWGGLQARSLEEADRNATINAWYGGISRTVRQLLQIAIMGLGAYLVLDGKMTAGMIFATTMVSGRALQPIDQLIGSWNMIGDARLAWARFSEATKSNAVKDTRMTELPAPAGLIHAEDLVWIPNGARTGEPIIKRLTFQIPAGSSVALVGPSGAGKSTLAKLLCGAIEPTGGNVRIDKADIRQWDRDTLGKHLGYLSQNADLLPGTIAQNIARFEADAKDEDIVAAAQKAQVHDLILTLPGGYGAHLGPGGLVLSGGQRQRVGLARAFYGSPRIMILDEPNANLDMEGDAALDRALQEARQDKVTIVMVTQRKTSADKMDNLMVLRSGTIEDYGPREQVVERQNAKMRESMARQQPQPPQQKSGQVVNMSMNFPKIGGDKLQ